MKSHETTFTRNGTVTEVHARTVTVALAGAEECSGCPGESACGLGAGGDRVVEAACGGRSFQVGDRVVVRCRADRGWLALACGYLIPFALLVAALLGASVLFDEEILVGLLGLGVVALYYLGLWSVRKRLGRTFILEAVPHSE